MKNLKNLQILNHPLLLDKLSTLREKSTTSHSFRATLSEISTFLAYEATRELKVKKVALETPLEKMMAPRVVEDVVIVSILRAGEGMVDGFLKALPFARVGHVGIYRDKLMNNTVEYYFRIPESFRGKKVFLLDPLLATGDTVLATLDRLKQYGVGPITFVSVLSSKIGIQKVNQAHPDVQILTLSVERELNEKGYLLPGLGDAGDRLFKTF